MPRFGSRSTLRAAALLAAVFGASCTESAPTEVSPDARLAGRLNGSAYVAAAEAFVVSEPGAPVSIHVYATHWNVGRGTSDRLTIRVALAGPGVYALDSSQVDLYELLGGDGVVGSHAGSRPVPGEFVVTEFDGPGTRLRGTVRFWLTPSRASMPVSEPQLFEGELTVRVVAPARN